MNEKDRCYEKEQKNFAAESPIVAALSELTGSLLKLAQERIVERVEKTAQRITYNVVMAITIVFLGLTGLIFMLVGFSLWIGAVSGLGVWFGLLLTGVIIFIVALIIALTHKNNRTLK
jgi:hypothetical protein